MYLFNEFLLFHPGISEIENTGTCNFDEEDIAPKSSYPEVEGFAGSQNPAKQHLSTSSEDELFAPTCLIYPGGTSSKLKVQLLLFFADKSLGTDGISPGYPIIQADSNTIDTPGLSQLTS